MAEELRVSNAAEFREHKLTFDHFLLFSLWGTVHIIMDVALLTVAFAMGFGWLAGVGAYFVIGAGAGLAMGMRGAWWGTVIGTTVLLAFGGLIALLFH